MNQPAAARGAGSLYLVDANNFLFRAFHALPMLNAPDGRPVNAVHGFCRMVQALRREQHPEYFVAIFDAGGSSFRRELFPEYKANRSEPPDELKPQFQMVRDATDALGIPRVQLEGAEADDLIAAYTVEGLKRGLSVTVVSSDKDLMQLVRHPTDGQPSVYLLDTMKSRVVGPEQVVDKFGVTPERLGDLLALAGDSSDNIPGVQGIGPKTAADLLAEYGNLEGILASAPEIKQKKRRERLIEFAEDARLSRRLVALKDDVPLPLPLDDLLDRGPDKDAVVEFFGPLNFTALLKEVGADAVAAQVVRSEGRTSEGAIELPPCPGFAFAEDGVETFAGDAAALADRVASMEAPMTLTPVVMGAEAMTAALLGMVIAGPEGRPLYVPTGQRSLELANVPQLELGDVLAALRGRLEDADVPKYVYDFKTTTLILERFGVALRGVVADPMLLSYTLDPARGRHALEELSADVLGASPLDMVGVVGKGRKQVPLDQAPLPQVGRAFGERCQATRALGRHLRAELDGASEACRSLYDEIEAPLAAVLATMERRGIRLDADNARKQAGELGEQIHALRASIVAEAGYDVNPDSPQQLQKLLFEVRGLPATRKTKTGYSTDAKALEELSLLDPVVGQILEYRALTKLKGTYLDPLPGLVNAETKRLHTSYRQAVAQTGRLSSSDPNLQNIPVRTALGRRIREAFVASPGHALVSLDYSQIELRVLAHMSGDPSLTSAFRDGVDVHRRTAAEVFGVPEEEVDDEQRRIAKAVNFGVIYGQTAFGLAQQLGVPRGKAGKYIKTYFERIPGVEAFMRELIAIAKARGYAETLLGRKRRIPELRRKGPARAHGERMARNTPIQGSAADIMKIAMVEAERQMAGFEGAQMLLTVHDELIFECKEEGVDALIDTVRPIMADAFELSVPLVVDAGSGGSWAACKG